MIKSFWISSDLMLIKKRKNFATIQIFLISFELQSFEKFFIWNWISKLLIKWWIGDYIWFCAILMQEIYCDNEKDRNYNSDYYQNYNSGFYFFGRSYGMNCCSCGGVGQPISWLVLGQLSCPSHWYLLDIHSMVASPLHLSSLLLKQKRPKDGSVERSESLKIRKQIVLILNYLNLWKEL